VRNPRDILSDALTIAVVGASRHPRKTAHAVPYQLLKHGWRVIPVNPYVDQIWGERCYPVLAEIPEPVDLVNVFRPSADATDVVRQAIAIGAKAVWLQQDIVSPEGRRMAEVAGIDYVEDACTAVVRAAHNLSRIETA
jgi:predicted CoA-binding protein